jgi:hypothetical protein
MSDSAEHIITLDDSLAENVKQAKQKLRIDTRTQEILRVDGATYDYCPVKAREHATVEVLGALANEEDINN